VDNESDLETTGEIQVFFSDEIEILAERLSDVIMAMGLPEEQTDAVLRLIGDIVEDHHSDILDAFEETIEDEGEAT